MSATGQRPAETAAHQHSQDEAALAVGQMTGGQDGHSMAVMAAYPGVSVADRTDPGVTGPAHPDLPAVPGADSKHTGPPA